MIRIHTALALAATLLTVAIFCLHKGSPLHRTTGWTWVIFMGIVAISSFWIHELRLIGPFSPIHILSIATLLTLVTTVRAVRARNITQHRQQMKTLVFGALLVAGAFTLMPGGIMHAVILGG